VDAALPCGLCAQQLERLLPLARAAIGGDERLMAARQVLVPKRLGERAFWAAYLRRCLTIKKEVALEFGQHALDAHAGAGGAGADGAAALKARVDEAWARELALTLGDAVVAR
jgi:hypothetical protein